MVHQLKLFTLWLFLNASLLSAAEFTISSYNCGGLSDHYDYLRAASMQQLMQERYVAEPEQMFLNEKIQKIALKILFSPDPIERMLAQQEWDLNGYEEIVEQITSTPKDPGSVNRAWHEKAECMITSYKVRPVVIHDTKVNQRLDEHVRDLTKNKATRQKQLQEVRKLMAMRIFAHDLRHDVICLQEADYLDPSMFPKQYEVLFSETEHSKNGIAWNKDRFELVESIGTILDRGFAIRLLDKETDKIVVIGSGHITGCNPYRVEEDPETGLLDSAQGDRELVAFVDCFDHQQADILVMGIDSNVTALHPRLRILQEAGYQIDCEHCIEPTCTNPYQILNTRIDWIALKSNLDNTSITNIPVFSVGFNNIQTNMSDHKPIAAKIDYEFYEKE
jgi:hypothetical protein